MRALPLLPGLVVLVLAACADGTRLLAPADALPADGAGLPAKGANSQGLIRLTVPTENPGVPAYTRIIPVPPHIYLVNGWAVIAFYRDPACVRPDFNLLTFFDVPDAFGCPLTVEGFALFEPEAFPLGVPKMTHLQGTGAVPFWFVPPAVMLAAIEDGAVSAG